jgi:hypothetical protein
MKGILKRIFLFIIGGLLLNSCNTSKFNVVKVNDAAFSSEEEGLYYCLPRSQFNIIVSVTKVEQIKGPYADFASKYLGLSNVIMQNTTDYELGEISIESTSIPDPSQYYFIEVNDKNSKTANDFLLTLSESGMILNTTGDDQSETFVDNYTAPQEEGNVYPDIFKYFSDLNLFEQVDTIFEKVNLDTATIEKMILRRTMVEKTPEQKAKDAADFIIKVKENRLNLISGFQEVNYDKETFTLMDNELEKLETEYQKLFTGLTFTKTLKYRFTYIPETNHPVDSIALFKFSKLRGVLDTSNMNGEMVYMKIERSGDTKPIGDYINKKEAPKKDIHGLYYRIPEYASIKVCMDGKPRVSARYLVSQYGVTAWLPAKSAKIQFFPGSGAMKKVEIKN